MSQLSFSDQEYSGRKRTTKREEFLKTMNGIIPWTEWVEKIRPFYPSGKRGRPVRGIELMLRMYLLQIWFGLSDEGTEDAIYDSYAMRSFLGLNFMMEQVPDATTLLKFRHLLEEHDLCKALFEDIKARLEKAGLMMHGGTIVDATIIQSTSSTKNKTGERDPEMHQTKKGNQYYHGMKAHIGVDAGSGYVHSLTGTAANAHDITEAHNLIREDDEVIYGDSGYTGIEKRDEIKEDKHLSQIVGAGDRAQESVRAMHGRASVSDCQAAVQILQDCVSRDPEESEPPLYAVRQRQYPHVRAGRPDEEVPKGLPWVRYAFKRKKADIRER